MFGRKPSCSTTAPPAGAPRGLLWARLVGFLTCLQVTSPEKLRPSWRMSGCVPHTSWCSRMRLRLWWRTRPSLGPVSCPANSRQDVWEGVEVAARPLPDNPLTHSKPVVPATGRTSLRQGRSLTFNLCVSSASNQL